MTDRKRRFPWRAKVRGEVKDFLTKQDAEFWERCQLQSYTLTGLPLTIEALKRVSVREIVERYLKEKTPLKGSAENETPVLKKFLKHPICKLSLAAIKKKDAYEYKNELRIWTRPTKSRRKSPQRMRTAYLGSLSGIMSHLAIKSLITGG